MFENTKIEMLNERVTRLEEQLEAAHASLALADVLIDNARVPDEEWGAMHVEYLDSRAALNPAKKRRRSK